MANLFFNIPVVANGVGAPVNISAAGALKSIVVQGSFSGVLIFEITVDGGVTWSQVTTFFAPDNVALPFAAQFIRVRSLGSETPMSAVIAIGTNDAGGFYSPIATPPTNGTGVALDITAFGAFKTFIVGGQFEGVISLEISENGVDFSEIATFQQDGPSQHLNIIGDFIRATSRGDASGATCGVGATNDVAVITGPVTITVEDEGVVAGIRGTINFIGAAVTAVDNPGMNRVDITIAAAALTNNPPTQIDVGDTAVVGVALDAARSDHQHALPAPAAPVNVNKSAAAAGASTKVAREDHKHDIDTDVPITVTGASNIEGVSTALARADHQHRLGLLVDEEGVAVGVGRPEINFIGAAVTAVDNPGADRVDITITSAALTNDPPTQIDIGDLAVVGVAAAAARADHQHALPDPAVVSTLTPDNAPSLGASTKVAREDHVHGIEADAPVTVTGATNSEGASTSFARADHLHRLGLVVDEEGVAVGVGRPTINFIGSNVTAVDNPGSDRVDITITGTTLSSSAPTQIDIGDTGQAGVATDASRADHQHALPVPTVVSTLTPDNAPSLGASTVVAREDHVHGIAADTAVTTGSANSEGVSTSFARADHVHIGTVAVQDEGVLVSREPIIDFVGPTVTATAGAGKVTVTITESGVATLMNAGSAVSPGIAVIGDLNTGIYSPGADTFAIATGGAQSTLFTTQGTGFLAGAVGTPGLFVIGDTDTGVYSPGANQLGVTAGATLALLFTTQGIGIGAGLQATPSLFIQGSVGTGMWSPAANQIAFSCATGYVGQFTTQGFAIPSGSAAAPSLFFIGVAGSNDGIYSPGGHTVAVATNGAQSTLFTTQGVGFLAGAVGTPGAFVIGDTDTGFYGVAANELGITAGGTLAASFTTQGFKMLAGAVGTPGLFVSGSATTGLYSTGAGQLAVAGAGVQAALFTNQGTGVPIGLVGTPGLFFIGDATTGFYSPGAGLINVTLAGVKKTTFVAAGINNPIGSAAAPSYSFVGDTNTGMYLISAGGHRLGMASNGATVGVFEPGQGLNLNVSASAAAPNLVFTGDTNTGFYQTAVGGVGFTSGGVLSVTHNAQGLSTILGAVATPSFFFQGDGNTGMYSPAADQIALTVGGSQIALFGTSVLFNLAVRTLPFALTYASPITINANSSNYYTVTLTGATTQLQNPTNLNAAGGQSFSIAVTQDATGGRNLTFDTAYDWGAEGAPTLSTSAANIVDIISCLVISSTKIACTVLRGF